MSTIMMLRLPGVIARTGLARSPIYRQISSGLLPTPVKLGARTVAWPAHEINAILKARVAGADDDRIRALVSDLVAARARLIPTRSP